MDDSKMHTNPSPLPKAGWLSQMFFWYVFATLTLSLARRGVDVIITALTLGKSRDFVHGITSRMYIYHF